MVRGWLLLVLLACVSLAATPGHAQDAESTAGLVIIDESGATGYALVGFEEPEISGIELLRRSGADPVTVSFGGLGEGVCGIGETGCAVDVCRRRLCQTGAADSPYWQSFAADGGAWAPLQLGASADDVRDGEVRLWAWTAAVPTAAVVNQSDISTKTVGAIDTLVWEGRDEAGVDGGAGAGSLWLGLGLLGLAGVVAATVTARARSRLG